MTKEFLNWSLWKVKRNPPSFQFHPLRIRRVYRLSNFLSQSECFRESIRVQIRGTCRNFPRLHFNGHYGISISWMWYPGERRLKDGYRGHVRSTTAARAVATGIRTDGGHGWQRYENNWAESSRFLTRVSLLVVYRVLMYSFEVSILEIETDKRLYIQSSGKILFIRLIY